MTEENGNEDNDDIISKLLGPLIDKLSIAKDIVKPTSLFALSIIAIVILAALSMYFKINVVMYSILIIFALSLYILGGYQLKTDEEELISEVPTDLKIVDELYNRIKDPLEKLNFIVTYNANSTKWGKTYYYTKAILDGRVVGLISLDPKYFKCGKSWRTGFWFTYIANIPQTPFNDLLVFSDTNTICQEAIYDSLDVKKDLGTEIMILTEIYTSEIKQASTTEEYIMDTLKLLLSI